MPLSRTVIRVLSLTSLWSPGGLPILEEQEGKLHVKEKIKGGREFQQGRRGYLSLLRSRLEHVTVCLGAELNSLLLFHAFMQNKKKFIEQLRNKFLVPLLCTICKNSGFGKSI